MKAANDTTLRVIADGLINRAECRPRACPSARHLRDAAASLLDADLAIQRTDADLMKALRTANENHPKSGEAA